MLWLLQEVGVEDGEFDEQEEIAEEYAEEE